MQVGRPRAGGATRTTRRGMLRRTVAIAAGAATFALACGLPLPEATGPPVAPDTGSVLVRPDAVPVRRGEVDLQIARSDVNRFLQDTLTDHQTYFATVRAEQGDAAAQQEIATVRAPFEQRLDEIQASGQQTISLRVPVVTLWDTFTFSATAYEGPLIVKDPVSIVFYWNGIGERIYQQSIDRLTCRPNRGEECHAFPQFQDEDERQGIPGSPFRCHTSPQWVLMGNAGGPLQWVKDVGGLMKTKDRCNRVGRDHIRIFDGPPHPVFGSWCVATPHQERFSFDPIPGKGGHIITSWNRAQHLYAGAWIESRLPNDRPGWDPSVFYWDRFDWGTGGEYQDVRFDGFGFLLGVQLPNS